MQKLPLCLEEIILDYKNQLEVTEKYDRCMEELLDETKYEIFDKYANYSQMIRGNRIITWERYFDIEDTTLPLNFLCMEVVNISGDVIKELDFP